MVNIIGNIIGCYKIFTEFVSVIGQYLTDLQNRADNYENEEATKGMLEDLDKCGLLEDASLVLTPTAYSEGVLHSTKPPITYGEELIVNGSFDTDSDWSKSPNWTISGGSANADGTAAGTGAIIFQSSAEITPAETFEVTYTISNYVRGTVFAGFGSQLNKQENIFFRSANGTYTEVITTTTATNFFGFRSHVDFEGSIDNVSVKKVNNADLTYTRTGTTTRTNADGNIETVAENVPVINYENSVAGIRIEDGSENLLAYSEDFSQSVYNKDSGVTVTPNSIISPDGSQSGTLVSVGSSGRIYVNNTSFTGVTSFYIKAGTFSNFKAINARVDLVSKTTSEGKLTEVGNGWFRFESEESTSSRAFQVIAYPDSDYLAHTSSGDYYIWGVQLEEKPQATSYIPTNGATATREPAVLSGGFEDLFDPQNGTLFIRAKNLANDGVRRQLILEEPVADDRIVFRFEPTANRVQAVLRDNGVGISTMTADIGDTLVYNNYFITWTSGEFKLYIGDTLIDTKTPNITGIQGISNLRTDDFNSEGEILVVYKRVLTQDEITCLNNSLTN